MMTYVVVTSVVLLLAITITVMDWLGHRQRKRREAQERTAAQSHGASPQAHASHR